MLSQTRTLLARASTFLRPDGEGLLLLARGAVSAASGKAAPAPRRRRKASRPALDDDEPTTSFGARAERERAATRQ